MLQLPMFVIHCHNDIHRHNADDVEQLQPAIIHYGICVCRLLWYLCSLAQEMYIASLIPMQVTPRFYLTAMEKNQEKVWDQNYITDRKWWTRLVQTESTLRTDRVHRFRSVT